jgi:hypothetical protein
MSKLGINTGSSPNAGDGDTLLVGAIKINSNFDELYNFLGNGSNLNVGIWEATSTGIYTTRNAGIGTTNAKNALTVVGDGNFTGVVTATTFTGQVNSGFGTISNLINTNSTITNLVSTSATITTYFGVDLTVGNVTTSYLTGIAGTLPTFNSTNATVTNLTNSRGTITNLTGTAGTITTLNSTTGTITNLTGTAGTITNFTSTNGTITNGTITNLTGTAGTITTLNSNNVTINGGTISNITLNNASISGVTTLTTISNTNIVSSGIITASQFSVGVVGSAINLTSNTISGPSEIFIDPSGVGDNTGSVRIKGDFYVDGTQTYINSTTIELGDFNVGVATTVSSDLILDGAGIGIGSTNIRKTLVWDYGSTSLKSNENFNIPSDKVYKVGGTEVLSSSKLTISNINSTGISTFSNAVVTNGNISNLTGSASTITTANATNLISENLNISGISTFSGITTVSNATLFSTQLSVSGVSTFNNVVDFYDNLNFSDDKYLDFGDTFRVYHASTEFAGGESSQVRDISGTFPLILGAKQIKLTDETGLTNYSVVNTDGITVTGSVVSDRLSVSGISTFNNDINVGVSTAHGVILTSPNGTRYRLIVDNDGSLSTTAV